MSNDRLDWSYKLFLVQVKTADKRELITVASPEFALVATAVRDAGYVIDESVNPRDWWQGQFDPATTATIVVQRPELKCPEKAAVKEPPAKSEKKSSTAAKVKATPAGKKKAKK